MSEGKVKVYYENNCTTIYVFEGIGYGFCKRDDEELIVKTAAEIKGSHIYEGNPFTLDDTHTLVGEY